MKPFAVIVVISGIASMVLDRALGIDSAPMYWAIGAFTGLAAALMAAAEESE